MTEEELRQELAVLLFQKERLTVGQASEEFEQDLSTLHSLGRS